MTVTPPRGACASFTTLTWREPTVTAAPLTLRFQHATSIFGCCFRLCLFRCRFEEPGIEDLYRLEQELNRVGKTRAEGKVLPLRNSVVELIKIADFNMEIVNWDRLDGEDGSDEDVPVAEVVPKVEDVVVGAQVVL